MAKHEFGIMDRTPVSKERYDCYEPEKYKTIFVEDELLEPLHKRLNDIDFFWHSLDVPGKGLAYCGITLIPPESMDAAVKILEEEPKLVELKKLLLKAKEKNKFVIHYGL